MKILILAAAPIELGSFDLSHINVKVVFTGIGKLNAFKATRKALRGNHYDAVINIGTCGSDKFPVGTVLKPSLVQQGDAFLLHDLECREFTVNGDPGISILTGDNFISKVYVPGKGLALPEKAQRFSAFDMESFAIASAASFMLKKLHFIKIVSDNLDSSLEDWEKSAERLASKLVFETESFIRKNFIKNYSVSKK